MYKAEDYLHLVQAVLNKYYHGGHYTARRIGVGVEDLYQVGCIGLIKASKDYDKEKGSTFISYAFMKIRGEIRVFVRDYPYTAKFSREVRELAPKILYMDDCTPDHLMQLFGISTSTAVELLDYVHHKDVSLDKPIKKSEDESFTYLDVIPAPLDTGRMACRLIELEERLALLSEHQQSICILLLQGRTQQEVANELGMNQSTCSRLLTKGLIKIQANYRIE